MRTLKPILLLCCLAAAPAQAQSDRTEKTFLVKTTFLGLTSSPRGEPQWRIEVPEADIRDAFGVLREGDRVTVELTALGGGGSGSVVLGAWTQDDRYQAHKTCKRSWLRKKCTIRYETRNCLGRRTLDPAGGPFRLPVLLKRFTEGAGAGTSDPTEIAMAKVVPLRLGGATPQVTEEISDQRRIVVSTVHTGEALVCARPRGELRGNPVRKVVRGASGPEPILALTILVEAPALAD